MTAAVGGGLTLWLQDSAEPPETRGRYQTDESPAPLLGVEVGDVEDEYTCPSQEPGRDVQCVYATAYTTNR
ncbi:hypothetical protein [Streptomyces sp. NEAU-NA10]|uniref:hypothetical protein n=1 Tax=Streptomyces sp. NEAU-NA10 TaxID=3416050 RepID=UPI003CC5C5F1